MSREIRITLKLPDLKGVKNFFQFLLSQIIRFFGFVYYKIIAALVRAWRDVKIKKKRGVVLLLLVALIYWKFGLNGALLWLLFLSFLFYGWENRIIATAALLCLASCPFLLHYKKDDLTETMAVYAYFFLVMTVVLQMAELKREESQSKQKPVNRIFFKLMEKCGFHKENR